MCIRDRCERRRRARRVLLLDHRGDVFADGAGSELREQQHRAARALARRGEGHHHLPTKSRRSATTHVTCCSRSSSTMATRSTLALLGLALLGADALAISRPVVPRPRLRAHLTMQEEGETRVGVSGLAPPGGESQEQYVGVPPPASRARRRSRACRGRTAGPAARRPPRRGARPAASPARSSGARCASSPPPTRRQPAPPTRGPARTTRTSARGTGRGRASCGTS